MPALAKRQPEFEPSQERVIPFGKPILGEPERQAVMEVLSGTTLVHGPKAKEFEKSFCAFTGAPHGISVSSCTAGLHLAYFFLGIGPGDEVIVPAETHTATAHAVEFTGAKPVFVDAEIETGNIDLTAIEAAVTPRTKAVSVVHFLGMPVAMDRVTAIARKYKLFVVEDCALALGARYKDVHVGLHGDIGVFSFYPAKHMTTSEGGMIITRHEDVAKRIIRQKAFGVDMDVSERKQPGIYDVTMLGYNYRLNEASSALGVEQLKRVPGFLEARRANHRELHRRLRELPEVRLFREDGGDFVDSHYCLSVLLEGAVGQRRQEVVASLKASGVGTSVYYPRPVPHFSYYRQKYGYSENTFPVAAKISSTSIALPVGPHLVEGDIAHIAASVKKAIHSTRHS